jgi:hypothetical protein
VSHNIPWRGEVYLTLQLSTDESDKVYEESLERVARIVSDAGSCEQCWSERIRAGLSALFAFLDEHRATARLLVFEEPRMRRTGLELHERTLSQAIAILEEGRRQPSSVPAPPLAGAMLANAALRAIRDRTLEPRRRSFTELTRPLTAMIVRAYLGEQAARDELNRPE